MNKCLFCKSEKNLYKWSITRDGYSMIYFDNKHICQNCAALVVEQVDKMVSEDEKSENLNESDHEKIFEEVWFRR